MPDYQHLILFVAAGWLLNLTPGPDVLYIVSNALRHGARAGVVAGLGITVGCFVHIFAAALGVTALLAASTLAFSILKWLGAAYLLWVGLQMLLARPKLAAPAVGEVVSTRPVPLKAVFMGGFWTNALNPKVAIFFLAFVPQFIAPGTENKALAFFGLGVLFNLNAIPINTAWALLASWTAGRAAVIRDRMHWLDRAAGAMFIGFGLKLALTDPPPP